jgi:hypothetical protein
MHGRVTIAGLVVVTAGLVLAFAHVACGSDDGEASPTDAGPPNVNDVSDPRCATQATLLGTHPHAKDQSTALGKTISDTRGWKGLLYFAYGDFEMNTGPIFITTFDPKTKTWQEHPVSYVENGRGGGALKSTPAFATHDIERFYPIGDSLWATAAQPMFDAPFNNVTAPEYAIATGGHDWKQVDIAPLALHVASAIERAPGDIYLTGSAIMTTDGGVGAAANGRAGGHIWRSTNGGPFTQLFPNFAASTAGAEYFDLSGAWIFGAALNGIAYMNASGFIYKHNGTTWDFSEDFGQFLAPAPFAGHIVFASVGQFFAFDGTKRKNLDFRFFESQGRYQARKETLALFQVTEGRLLAVKYGGDVMMTTDLVTWTCIGKAPADASSIGSLDGIVYFGSVNSGVYGFPSPSW